MHVTRPGHEYCVDVQRCLLCLMLSVDSNEEVKNLNRINKNNFARLPRTKKELSDQMAAAVCQFLASCVYHHVPHQPHLTYFRFLFSQPTFWSYSRHDVPMF